MNLQGVLDALPTNFTVSVFDQETKELIFEEPVSHLKEILGGYNYPVTQINATGKHYKITVICN